jgi:lipopolysaccharide exporter
LLRMTWRVSPLPTLVAAAPFVSVSVWFSGATQLMSMWASRRRRFGLLSRSRVVQAIMTGMLQVLGSVLWTDGSTGLVFGYAVGLGTGLAILLGNGGHHLVIDLARHLSARRLMHVSRRFRRFSLVSSSGSVFDAGAAQLPAFVLGGFFGNAVVGHFALAYRLLSAPLNLLGSAVAQVFYQAASERRADAPQVGRLTGEVFQRLLLLGGVPLAIVGVIGPELFGLVFGAAWGESGVYARILIPWLLVQFVLSPLTYLFFVNNNQRLYLVFNLCQFVGLGLGLLAGSLTGSGRIAIGALSLGGCGVYLLFLNVALRTVDLRLGKLLREVSRDLAMASIIVGALAVGVALNRNEFIVVAEAGVAAMVYFAVLYLRYRNVIQQLTNRT